jgi:hypothetical protein
MGHCLPRLRLCIHFHKEMSLAMYVLGDCFINSSGHPDGFRIERKSQENDFAKLKRKETFLGNFSAEKMSYFLQSLDPCTRWNSPRISKLHTFCSQLPDGIHLEFRSYIHFAVNYQEPILRLLTLQLQRLSCSRPDRFSK